MNRLVHALATVSLLACTPVDQGNDGALRLLVDGDLPDAGSAESRAAMFESCRRASECDRQSSVCLRAADGFVDGLCTRPCVTDASCPEGGVCVAGHCQRACRSTCPRDGYVCIAGEDEPLHCQSHCGADAECEGARCDLASGRCVPRSDGPSPRLDLAHHCESPSECAGDMCLWSFVDPRLDGYCSRPCEVRARDPRSNCPAGARCVPVTSVDGPGGLGGCVVECRGHADCAPGYACQQIVDLRLCVPTCGDAHPCPRGFFCDERSEDRPICRHARH